MNFKRILMQSSRIYGKIALFYFSYVFKGMTLKQKQNYITEHKSYRNHCGRYVFLLLS